MLKKWGVIFLCLLFFSQLHGENKLVGSYPANENKVQVLSYIEFVFDLTDSYNSDHPKEDVGINAEFTRSPRVDRKLYFYKGDSKTGELLETVVASVDGSAGSSKVTVPLSKEYQLEEGQLYTIDIPANCFWSFYTTTKTSYIDKTSPSIKISFYGGEDKGTLSYKGSIPKGGDLGELGTLTLNFSEEIKLAENATASLYKNDSTFVKEVPLTISKDSSNAAVADFGNERFLVYNNYSVKVPKEAIMKNDTTNTALAQDILVSYTGTSYYLFNYKTITPDSGSVLSTIGKVVLIPEFPTGSIVWDYCGDDAYKGEVSLYKGTDETGELVGTYSFNLGNDLKSETGNVTAELAPNETYALVIPEGLVPVRGSITIGKQIVSMLQTHHSAKTTVLYTGANTALEGKWSVTVNDQLSKLGLVSFMTGGTAMANEGAKMELYNGEDSIASATLNASGNLCYADFGGLALEQDGDYSLVIPDSAIVNMPKTIQKFKGIAKPAEYAKVSYKSNGITVASEQVLKGSSVKVGVAMPDSIQLDSLMLNGEKVALADSAYAIDSLAADAEIEAALTYIPTPVPETKYYNVNYILKSVVGDDELVVSSTSTKIAEDSLFTYKAEATDNNWTVNVSTGDYADSAYSVKVTGDTAVVVTLAFNGKVAYVDEESTGIFTLDSQEMKISTTEGKIVVEGAKVGDTISLYTLNGSKIGQWTVENDRQTIDVNSGVYLVVVKGEGGQAAAKVSVK